MILREFLYVDTDKVRGMLAQLDGGVAEEQRDTTKKDKRTEGGVKGFVGHYQGWGEESYVTKSFGDALFPSLEEALESEGLIRDLSEELQDEAYWLSELREAAPPGTLIRVTSQGSLFDARYVAASLAGFGATHGGLEAVGATEATVPTSGNRGRVPKPKNQKAPEAGREEIEDSIPEFSPIKTGTGGSIGREYLRGIVKISRGLFMPGLHLNLYPTDNDTLTIGARLQEGRHFLDGDPEILFARYGTGKQQWTLVGTVGHYAGEDDREAPSLVSIADDDGNVFRGRTAAFINSYMRFLGGLGFADVPQWPGFNVVPLAVYRSIARTQHAQALSPATEISD